MTESILITFPNFIRMDFQGARAYIQNQLRTLLSKDLYYHGYHHTLDVVIATQKFGRLEQVSEDDMVILQTAAWFHDSGFLNVYRGHEAEGCKIAGEALPRFGYTPKEIEQVQGMIMATKVPQQPKNTLEQVLCDADLEYLGGDNYYTIAESLRKELFAKKVIEDHRQWVEMQVSFLEMHQYFTTTAKNLCNKAKSQRLEELREQLEGIPK